MPPFVEPWRARGHDENGQPRHNHQRHHRQEARTKAEINQRQKLVLEHLQHGFDRRDFGAHHRQMLEQQKRIERQEQQPHQQPQKNQGMQPPFVQRAPTKHLAPHKKQDGRQEGPRARIFRQAHAQQQAGFETIARSPPVAIFTDKPRNQQQQQQVKRVRQGAGGGHPERCAQPKK